MRSFRVHIVPRSAFGTLPLGDTLFGQLCWALRNRFGETRLNELLDGYTEGRPFAVVSDALPAGYLPKPTLPGHLFHALETIDRKIAKKRQWLPLDHLMTPVENWLEFCISPNDLPGSQAVPRPQPHNSINRKTGTTDETFAPYNMTQHWYGEHVTRGNKKEYLTGELAIYIVLDETRLTRDELNTALTDIGELGFGRDASIGLGRFRIQELTAFDLPTQSGADAWLTLAPCAPQGLQWDTARCFYQVFTRFGRHGDAAVLSGKPFKTPVLLAETGALLTPSTYEPKPFTGQGLGGDGSLSKTLPQTVQQGYAPVVAIRCPKMQEAS